jgi:ribosomal protein L29
MASKFEAFRTQTDQGLRSRLKELSQENFQAKFTSEAMTPTKGAQIKARRREIARIQTVLKGREAQARLQAEAAKLEERIKKLGKADARNCAQRATLASARKRHTKVARSVKALESLKAK